MARSPSRRSSRTARRTRSRSSPSPQARCKYARVTNGLGTIAGADVTNVAVTCTTTKFTVGGTITGLAATGGAQSVVLENNGGDTLSVAANGPFTFATALPSGAQYAITVKTQPSSPPQTCTVSGGTGTVGTGNVTGVVVNCATNKFTVGGTITGLAGTVVLQNNAGDNLTINANSNFAFGTPIVSGGAYAVTVLTQPGTPSQTCTVTSGSGTVGATNVTSVAVACTTNKFTIGGTLAGLASGATVVLQNKGGDNLTLTSNGAFNFATTIASGGTYAVTVLTTPTSPMQSCAIVNASGSVAACEHHERHGHLQHDALRGRRHGQRPRARRQLGPPRQRR